MIWRPFKHYNNSWYPPNSKNKRRPEIYWSSSAPKSYTQSFRNSTSTANRKECCWEGRPRSSTINSTSISFRFNKALKYNQYSCKMCPENLVLLSASFIWLPKINRRKYKRLHLKNVLFCSEKVSRPSFLWIISSKTRKVRTKVLFFCANSVLKLLTLAFVRI